MDVLHVSPDGHELVALLADLPRPVILGVAGPPGSGKSTLARALGHTVVPLDGFHLADVELERRGLRDRKGAPETFDAWGYAALLARLRARPDHVVMAPGFERGLEQPLAGAIPIPPGADVLVAEGNYLLLDQPSWRAVRQQLDVVWQVVVDDEVRRQRLVERHVRFGKSPAAAEEWAARVDEPNARLVQDAREHADVLLDLTRWSGAALRRTPSVGHGGAMNPLITDCLANADRFSTVVSTGGDWSGASPCTDWDGAAVLHHVVDSQREFLATRGADLGPKPEGEPAEVWRGHLDAVRNVVADEAFVTEEYDGYFGRTSIADTLANFYGFDMAVHRWDLGRALGQEVVFDEAELDRMEQSIAGFGDALYTNSVCAPALDVPPDAPRQTRVLGLLGRRA